jgi:CheY-like chemotaxis protein
LQIRERRSKPRAKLNPREGATLTALTGIFEGLGMTGIIENISESGARIRVERAMEIKGERKQSLHTSLIQPGHAFGILRLSKLPRMSGAWECSGRGIYLEGGSAGLFLGVAFNSFPPEAQSALRSLISSRIGAIPSTLPPKTRRNQEPEPSAEVVPAPRPTEPAPAAEVTPKPDKPSAAPPTEPEVFNRESAAPEPASPTRNLALLRLKKRSRTLAVVMTPENAHSYLLVDHLVEEGYGKVQVARTLQELLDLLADTQPSLLFIDDGVAELRGIDLVDAMRRLHEELPPIVLAQEEISAGTVLAARRAGVANLMVKPYELDDAFSAILEGALGF